MFSDGLLNQLERRIYQQRIDDAWKEREEAMTERDQNYFSSDGNKTIKETIPEMRTFEGGASRNTDEGKIDYEGLLSPFALKVYCEYMNGHRKCADGSIRDSDNWQSGFGPGVCMKSLMRHIWDAWMVERGGDVVQDGKAVTKKEALCAAMFNIMSQLHDMEKPGDEK